MNVLFIEDEVDFSLIGIHSIERPFELFEYEDELNFRSFYLIKNKYFSYKKLFVGLFEEEMTEINYVIPEKKEVDYFIKIHDCETSFLTFFLEEIKKIEEIQTAYVIDAENLKSKQNLIF